jgi:hypothetical protein
MADDAQKILDGVKQDLGLPKEASTVQTLRASLAVANKALGRGDDTLPPQPPKNTRSLDI